MLLVAVGSACGSAPADRTATSTTSASPVSTGSSSEPSPPVPTSGEPPQVADDSIVSSPNGELEVLPVGRPDFDMLESPRRCQGGGSLADGPMYTTVDEIVSDARPDQEVAIMQVVSVSDGVTLTSMQEVEAMPDVAPDELGVDTVDVVYRVLEVLSPDSPVSPGDTLRMALANESRDNNDCTGDEPDVGTVEINFFTCDLSSYGGVSPTVDVDAITLSRLGIHRGSINAFVPLMFRFQSMASFDRTNAKDFVDDLAAALAAA